MRMPFYILFLYTMPCMLSVQEFRVSLPISVEEYQIGQLYSCAEASKNETGGGEGVEVLRNEPFTDYPLLSGKFDSGQYTHKIYHLSSKVPSWIRSIAPKGSLEIHEEAWNAYPYCRTVLTNPGYMKQGFMIKIETFHVADRGEKTNVHELPKELLQRREVVVIDIAHDPIQFSDYKESEDPKLYVSKKTGRGPLTAPDWRTSAPDPVMTAYKLVTIEFKWWGLQNMGENVLMNTEHRLFTTFHRQVFCWMDHWYGMTLEEIRKHEEQTKADLEHQRKTGQARGKSM